MPLPVEAGVINCGPYRDAVKVYRANLFNYVTGVETRDSVIAELSDSLKMIKSMLSDYRTGQPWVSSAIFAAAFALS